MRSYAARGAVRPVAVLLLLGILRSAPPSSAQHAQHLPYFESNLIVMEMENFSFAASSQWSVRPWLQSRFAASVADTYLSRRAFLHGLANISASSSATMNFDLSADEAGCYDVLLRYESALLCQSVTENRSSLSLVCCCNRLAMANATWHTADGDTGH